MTNLRTNILQMVNTLCKEPKPTSGQFNILYSITEAMKNNPELEINDQLVHTLWTVSEHYVLNGNYAWVMMQRNILGTGRQIPNKKDWMVLFEKTKIKKEEAFSLLQELWKEQPNVYLAWILTEPSFKKVEKIINANENLQKAWAILQNLNVLNEHDALTTRWNLIDMLKSMLSPNATSAISTEDLYENH